MNPQTGVTDLRQFADHAAQTLMRVGGLRGARQLGLAGELAKHEINAANAPEAIAQRAAEHRVGIWKAATDGSFVRARDVQQDWVYWASVGRIPPKTSRPRIVFLGESAARGFFYDPLFNPAQALETMLAGTLRQGVDIVDLARIDITLPELSCLFEEAFELQPDAFVIYAGNNWGNTRRCDRIPDSLPERERRAAALRSQGVTGLGRLIQEQLVDRSVAFVQLVARHCRQRGIPAVIVVPEYNLVDWRDSPPIVPWLAGDRNRRWLTACCRAQAAMAVDDFDAATAAASEMVELDRGCGALGLFILGECARHRGDIARARVFLERARDAVLWDPLPHSPRGFGAVQSALRREAAAHSLGVVDLAEVFSCHLGGELPDRRLFIDYCHLTIAGMRVAMAAVAQTLLPLLGEPAPTLSSLESTALPVSPGLEAQAHFATAIHTAHWAHDCDEVIEYHCRAALQKDPGLRNSMRHYMELTTRQSPVWMSDAAASLASLSVNPSVARYIIGTLPMQPKVLDRVLCDTIASLLGNHAELELLRIEEHACTDMDVDLLSTYASLGTVGDREALWFAGSGGDGWAGYFKAYRSESRFVFIERESTQGWLRLVVRTSAQLAAESRFVVELNGCRLFAADMPVQWANFSIGVPASCVRRGLNEVVIRWPPPSTKAETELDRAAGDLEQGNTPELYPVFAEIHSLVYGRRSAS